MPAQDPSLLFTNAGMVQFKSVFLGEETRPYRRAASAQKCLRAGGKHNDLDQVGRTARHHTFFEMLGNFSFGDYFKAEAIEMAWQLLTRDFALPKDRLWATVYQNDDEAETLWRNYLPSDRVLRLGDSDNFWQMGETGPCGPCSELLIDQGDTVHPNCPGIGQCACDRYLEIWNLVFMQYHRSEGRLFPLPLPSIDTGMGLERLTAVCQGVSNNYETDVFVSLFSALAKSACLPKEEVQASIAGRVICDHLRAITFLVAEGVAPSNEGRGYVLRRILRRAARFGKKLGLTDPFLHTLTDAVVSEMQSAYPELLAQRQQIARTILREETRFSQTLAYGIAAMEEIIKIGKHAGTSTLSGEAIFKLYDTYGFPVDLSEEMAAEAGLSIHMPAFHAAMETQKQRARQAWERGADLLALQDHMALRRLRLDSGPTHFTGYVSLDEAVTLLALYQQDGTPMASAEVDQEVELVFDRTPCYGEGGGQVGDSGTLIGEGGCAMISNTTKPLPDLYVHHAKVTQGVLKVGARYRVGVDPAARRNTARNHTATHLLHAVLRDVFGDHVRQTGSLVAKDRLRFDFSHFAPLSEHQIQHIETQVNTCIYQGNVVTTSIMETEVALASGAMALFGEKYDSQVRVVEVADVSRELCGGTHCRDVAEIGLFKIVREGSVASGMRRIEALTGPAAYAWLQEQQMQLGEVARRVKGTPADLLRKIDRLMAQLETQKAQIDCLRMASSPAVLNVQQMGGIGVIIEQTPPMAIAELRAYADRLSERLSSGIVVVGAISEKEEMARLVVKVTSNYTKIISASEIAKEGAKYMQGAGGGSPSMAQAGGTASRLATAMQQISVWLHQKLEEVTSPYAQKGASHAHNL